MAAEEVVREGVEFGTTYRDAGWGAGLTVLVAMANVLPSLDPHDRPRALVHGLAFVSRDTRGRPPSFPLRPLGSGDGARTSARWTALADVKAWWTTSQSPWSFWVWNRVMRSAAA